jgi:hypothetical protein
MSADAPLGALTAASTLHAGSQVTASVVARWSGEAGDESVLADVDALGIR